MANTEEDEPNISVKLIIDKVKKRVVYAESDYTFVDTLFSFMTLPLGTIARILQKHDDNLEFEVLGSLKNLYQSLKDFPESCLATKECKSMLLNPRSAAFDHCRNLKLEIDDTEPMECFVCRKCNGTNSTQRFYFSICNKARCRKCNWRMKTSREPNSDVSDDGDGVFVSETATFIITDELLVMPYTAKETIRLLKDTGVTDKSHLETRKVDIGCEQMLDLMKLPLLLDSPLTHFFLRRRNKRPRLSDCLGQGTSFRKLDSKKKGSSAKSKMVLEVYLQKSTRKVLFAEAKQDFVDFLFSLLSIPLGTVIGELLKGDSSVTCMDNLYKSISNMSVKRYLKSQEIKDILLEPHSGQQYPSKNQLFSLSGTDITQRWRNTINPFRNGKLCDDIAPIRYRSYKLKDPRIKGQYLKPSGMFFVTDDLIITPSSSFSTMDTLDKLEVELDDIETYEIHIGLKEGLRILKALVGSKFALTSIIEHQFKK